MTVMDDEGLKRSSFSDGLSIGPSVHIPGSSVLARLRLTRIQVLARRKSPILGLTLEQERQELQLRVLVNCLCFCHPARQLIEQVLTLDEALLWILFTRHHLHSPTIYGITTRYDVTELYKLRRAGRETRPPSPVRQHAGSFLSRLRPLY